MSNLSNSSENNNVNLEEEIALLMHLLLNPQNVIIQSSNNEDTESKEDMDVNIKETTQLKLWNVLNEPNTEYIAVKPIYDEKTNSIFYTTYHSIFKKAGIYSYDINKDEHECIKLYKEMKETKYYPKYYASCFAPSKDVVYFVGGDEPYDQLMIYDIKSDKLEKIDIKIDTDLGVNHIGCNPAILCTNTDLNFKKVILGFIHDLENKYQLYIPSAIIIIIEIYSNNDNLHIIGGENNNKHFLWNAKVRRFEVLHSFDEYENGIRGQSLIHNYKMGKMYMIGGCDTNTTHYKDVWCFDMETSIWHKNSNWELPIVLCGFGSVLYDDRILIVFGGRTKFSHLCNRIYYLDVTASDSKWIEIENVKCPFHGCCNALLVQKESIVHLLPFGNYNHHTTINVYNLLPSELLN